MKDNKKIPMIHWNIIDPSGWRRIDDDLQFNVMSPHLIRLLLDLQPFILLSLPSPIRGLTSPICFYTILSPWCLVFLW